MLTKAIILGKEQNTNLYTIRIPLLETSASNDMFIMKATLCCDEGVINPFNVGDVVYIGFQHNEYDSPVIIGKLSKEGLLDNERSKPNASYYINSLEVVGKTKLSSDIQIGDISYKDLHLLIQKVSSLNDELNSGFNDKDIGIYMTETILRIYLYNFTDADIGKKIYLFRTTHKGSKGFKHPDEYGYGIVADNISPAQEIPTYPEVPNWMPNNGLVQTEWTITQEMISQGYFEINWIRDWVSLVIPHWDEVDEYWDWLEKSSIFGTAANRGPVKMKFGLVNSGTLQFLSTGTLFMGVLTSVLTSSTGYDLLLNIDDEDVNNCLLNNKRIYKSVK